MSRNVMKRCILYICQKLFTVLYCKKYNEAMYMHIWQIPRGICQKTCRKCFVSMGTWLVARGRCKNKGDTHHETGNIRKNQFGN